jgi:hypothetical protein
MCIVEQKTYLEANGNPRLIERIRRCEKAVAPGTCSNTRQTFETVKLVETKPESSSSSQKDEVVTDNNGRTRTYRDIGRHSSQKHKTSHSKRSEKRDSADLERPAPSPAFQPRRPSPASRPGTPNSAPPTMSSFTPEGYSEPRLRQNGTAVYNLSPSMLTIPRAPMNERLNTRPAERKVSFEDDTPRRHPYAYSNDTGARDSAMPSPTMSSPGLSRLPSIRHNRTDSARDIPFRDFVKPEREDKEHAARELARETARRQRSEAESNRRRQEDFENRQRDLEAAENRQLDLEAERARNRLFVDPPVQQPQRRLPESFFSYRESLADDEPASWSRHTSPSAPPRVPRPTPATRFASASPLPTSSRSSRTYGRTVVHQYHYPDSPPVVVSNTTSTTSSRRPSDSIRERGREVIERERTRAAAAELQRAAEQQRPNSDVGAGPRRWEPVFDEYEERVSGREYYHVSEGPARQESRRRHGSWREERKRDFWS